MDRDDLLALCEIYVRGRVGKGIDVVFGGRVDPAAEIHRCYRNGEITERERNSLLAFVSDHDEELDCGFEESGWLGESPFSMQ
jgi:hypothetical protein